jgi:VWFA-related protein
MKNISILITILLCLTFLGRAEQTETAPVAASIAGNPGSRYVEVIVLNDDDEHIPGLKKGAFKLTLNGVEQQISSVREINLLKAGEDSKQYDTAMLKDNPLYHFILIANVPADNRQLIKMKEGLLEFLGENENTGAPMEIFIVNPGGISKLTEMTVDINALNAEIISAFSAKIFCNEMSFFMEDTKFTLAKNLTDFANSLEKVEGSKKIIFMSAGIPDTFGLDYFDINPIAQGNSQESESLKKSQSLDQQRQEAKKRKEFSDSLSGLAAILNRSNVKIDFVDLSKSTRSSRPGEGLADSRSSSNPSSSSAQYTGSSYSNTGDQYAYGAMMKVDSEVKLRIARDLAAAGGGELFEKALSSSGKLKDYLNQILYINAHYYLIEFTPKVVTDSEDKLVEIKLEVENDDVEKVIYNKNLYIE